MPENPVTTLAANLDTARHLAISGALKSTTLKWGGSGWVLLLSTSSGTTYLVKTDRNAIRFFRSVEAAMKFARLFFIDAFDIDFSSWTPKQKTIGI